MVDRSQKINFLQEERLQQQPVTPPRTEGTKAGRPSPNSMLSQLLQEKGISIPVAKKVRH
jgi:hypothetical protein